MLGFVPLAFRGAYVASKYALEGLTDTMRLELHGSNIHVSTIEPGPITSQFRENARKRFIDVININQSAYKARYQTRLEKMESELPDRFEKSPEAVFEKLRHAIENASPKPYYMVTFPTYLMASLKRLLPSRHLLAFLRSAGD